MVEMTELIRDGKLTIPLFHGTSTLFYDSIVEFGLGGRDVLSDFGIRAAARLLVELWPIVESDPLWESEMRYCRKIAKDPSEDVLLHDSGFNFRYGGTYVSPSREDAARYSSQVGSEALTCILCLLRLLESKRPDLASRQTFTPIRELASQSGTPMIVEALDVNVSFLRAEQGGLADDIMQRIDKALECPEFFDSLISQHNFELLQPIPTRQLRFYRVLKYKDLEGFDKFNLEIFSPNAAQRSGG
jgi:hypothetical protein